MGIENDNKKGMVENDIEPIDIFFVNNKLGFCIDGVVVIKCHHCNIGP